jgi:hypothetical protein
MVAMKEKLRAEGHLIECEENPFSIAIVTPLMQRTAKHYKDLFHHHQVPVFLDSSASCDQTNSSITTLLIPTKAGAVPIGICLHSNQNEENYTHVFRLINSLLEKFELSISCFMTDNAKALKNALKSVWPNVPQFLCNFHTSAAFWTWLCSPKNNVSSDERQNHMVNFKQAMYSVTLDELYTARQKFLENAKKGTKLRSHFEAIWKQKTEWCMFFRLDTLNRAHNTNNFAEATFRVFKEIVLCRLKAHNPLSLLSFVANELDDYFSMRLTSHAFDRFYRNPNAKSKFFDRGQMLIDSFKDDFKQIGDSLYEVPSASGEGRYIVNSAIGHCTCVSGKQGALCKHQCAVTSLFNVAFPNAPSLSPEDKMTLYQVAQGEKMRPAFFKPLTPKISKKRPFSNEKENFDSAWSYNENDRESDWESCSSDIDSSDGAPPQKKGKKSGDLNIMAQFDSACNKMRGILGKNETDEYLVKQVTNFCKNVEKLETGMQLAAFCEQNRGRKKGSKRIPVQGTSIPRRNHFKSCSTKVQRAGRPITSVQRVHKRPRNQALNEKLNQLNGKSHGSAH